MFWRTPNVLLLANVIRQAPSRLPESLTWLALADALEEAGCTNQEMMRHFRRRTCSDLSRCVILSGADQDVAGIASDGTVLAYAPTTCHTSDCWMLQMLLRGKM